MSVVEQKICGLRKLLRRLQSGTFGTGELARAHFAGEPVILLLATPHRHASLFTSFPPGCGQAMMPSWWRASSGSAVACACGYVSAAELVESTR